MDAVNSRTAEDATVSKIVKTHRTESEASALISNFGESLASTIHLDDIIATVRDGHNSDVVTAHSSTLPLDTRMSSVRRHEATGGNLIADAMFWMLQPTVPTWICHFCPRCTERITIPTLHASFGNEWSLLEGSNITTIEG